MVIDKEIIKSIKSMYYESKENKDQVFNMLYKITDHCISEINKLDNHLNEIMEKLKIN